MNYHLLLDTIYRFAPLLLGLIVIRFVSLPIKTFQAVFLGLAAAFVFLHSSFLPDVNLLVIFAILISGEVAHLIFIGVYGRAIKATNCESILVGIGLFPWYLSNSLSISYIMFSFLILIVVSWVRFKSAERYAGVKVKKYSSLGNSIGPEKLKIFNKKASVMIPTPIFLGAVMAIALTQNIFN